MAPEVLEHLPYNQLADVYSFAITLWELLTARVPYCDMAPMQVENRQGIERAWGTLPCVWVELPNVQEDLIDLSTLLIQQRRGVPHISPHSFLQAAVGVVTRGLRPVLPDSVPPALSRLIERCWSRDVAERPAFAELTPLLQQMLEEERAAAVGGSRRPAHPLAAAGPGGPAPACTPSACTAACTSSERLLAGVHTAVQTATDTHTEPPQQQRMASSSSGMLASSLTGEDGHEGNGRCVHLRGMSA